MPTVRPFRALRYDDGSRGPLDALVAPPYDVISAEARAGYLARSPYNVVHLTLPDSEEQAGRDLAALARRGRARRATRARTGGSPRTTSAPTASRARARASPRRSR